MSLMSQSSQAIRIRGYECYKNNMVIQSDMIDNYNYKGKVKGSGDAVYDVAINLKKPRLSICTCPYAKDNQKICKHMIALLFSIDMDAVEEFEEELHYIEEEELFRDDKKNKLVTRFINDISIGKLKQLVYDMLMSKEEWVIYQYIEDYGD